jgi:hypothetical protein
VSVAGFETPLGVRRAGGGELKLRMVNTLIAVANWHETVIFST